MHNISNEAWSQLNLLGSPSDNGIWDTASSVVLPYNHNIGEPKRLFKPIKDEDIERYKEVVAQGTELEDLF